MLVATEKKPYRFFCKCTLDVYFCEIGTYGYLVFLLP